MGQSVDAFVAYGFGIRSDGTPEEIEEFIDTYGENCGLSGLLDVGFACWGDDTMPPVIYVKSSVIRAMEGVPRVFEPADLQVTQEEMDELKLAKQAITDLIQADPDYDERWSAKVGETGWIVWGKYW